MMYFRGEYSFMKLTSKEWTITLVFAALITIGAFIKVDIPLPVYTMHFTLQWFFVLMAGFLLGARHGAFSVLIYVLIGLIGVPVFATGGGFLYILKPGFGFLLGFIVAAYIIGFMIDLTAPYKYVQYVIPSICGLLAYYAVGSVYFYLIKNLYSGMKLSFSIILFQYCLITIFPDFVLCLIASGFAMLLSPIFKRAIRVRI